MENEIWKDIPGWYGFQVSDIGNLRSFRSSSGRNGNTILNPNPHSIRPSRYTARRNRPERYLCLSRRIMDADGIVKHKSISLHKAVVLAFVGPRRDGYEIRHLDGNIDNCRLDNLKYGTHTENMADKKIHGTELIGSRSTNAKLTEEIVLEIRQKYASGRFTSCNLANLYLVSDSAISEIILNHTWKHVSVVVQNEEPFDPPIESGDPFVLASTGFEIWRHIPGYYGYQISNLKNVRSRWKRGARPRTLGHRWVIMKQTVIYGKNGKIVNSVVRLCPPNEKPCTVRISKLMSIAFSCHVC